MVFAFGLPLTWCFDAAAVYVGVRGVNVGDSAQGCLISWANTAELKARRVDEFFQLLYSGVGLFCDTCNLALNVVQVRLACLLVFWALPEDM